MRDDLETLKDLAEKEQLFLPEMGGTLSRLEAALRLVAARDLPWARTRLATDLSTLVAGLAEVVALREAGHGSEAVDRLLVDLNLLAAGMRQRAAQALESVVAEASLHATVALEDIGPEGKPLDLSREFRIMAAAPAPEGNGAGQVIRTGFKPGEGAIGSIEGDFMALIGQPDLKVAPAGAAVLPVGAVLHLAPGERISVHVRGCASGGVPVQHDFAAVHVEARTPTIIHGPALVSPSVQAARADMLRVRNKAQTLLNDLPEEGRGGMLITVVILAGGLAASFFNFYLAISISMMTLVGVSVLWHRLTGQIEEFSRRVREILDDPVFPEIAHRFGYRMPEKDRANLVWYGREMDDLVRDLDRAMAPRELLTFFPADMIHSRDGRLRIMEPLKSIAPPAPVLPGNVVALRDREAV